MGFSQVQLSDLTHGFDVRGGGDRSIAGVTEDSRRIAPGMLFVAVPGTALDGHDYIADAITRGAVAVAAERVEGIPANVAVIAVPSARAALATLAARFHGEPGRELRLIGFTGTFGKTSTSDILRALLDAGGQRTGVLGSLGGRFGTFHDPGHGLTTPAPPELHRTLRGLRETGADTVIMEVTSHALGMGRVDGLRFTGGLLAAIRPGEHTDFHRSYEDYVDAKRRLLDYLTPDALLAYDADNRAARDIARAHPQSLGFSLEGRAADLVFRDVKIDPSGARFTLIPGHFSSTPRENRCLAPFLERCQAPISVASTLLGRGHLRNVALALTYALAAGVDVHAAQQVLAGLQPLRRRMERYEAAGRTILDDTAAHPESFRATFEVAALLAHDRTAVVYAIRGNRGVDINRRNALALADLAAEHGIAPLILTASAGSVGPLDCVSPDEAEAARDALERKGQPYLWRDTLGDAIDDALERTAHGDLIVLIGAQGMNEGKALIGHNRP
jgi:UDP-N-acetylmuramoyl-L-alanyl-D-glutamate--2,6-diaminopimelate ligase